MKRLLYLVPLFAALLAVPARAQSHSVALSWTAPTDPGVNYNVYRLAGSCPASGTAGAFVKINTAPVTSTSYTDSTVALGTSCYYVTATLNGAESVPSNTVSGVVLPGAPTLLKITGTT
jgi:hypothetical protein